MLNIFQGNQLIVDRVASTLGYKKVDKSFFFTEKMYMQAFFYLSKRFGQPTQFDESKEAGAWHFKVDKFQISIHITSSHVEFIMYGKYGHNDTHSPWLVKYSRERRKKQHLLIDEGRWFNGTLNGNELQTLERLFGDFIAKNNIPENTTQKEFDKKYFKDWHSSVLKYNHSIIGVDRDVIESKYGKVYQNFYTRRALRVLDKFLKNMLTPIWIRDCAFNIKGELHGCSYERYERYKNNIKIELI